MRRKIERVYSSFLLFAKRDVLKKEVREELVRYKNNRVFILKQEIFLKPDSFIPFSSLFLKRKKSFEHIIHVLIKISYFLSSSIPPQLEVRLVKLESDMENLF